MIRRGRMQVHQVRPYMQWPSGDSRPIVRLRANPAELQERYGILFEHDSDDFDEYDLAAIELPDRTQAWLMRHVGNPESGTIVYVDASVNFEQAKDFLVDMLSLSPQEITWITPFLAHRSPY